MRYTITALLLLVTGVLSAQLPTASWGLTPTGNGQSYCYDNTIDANGNTFILGAYGAQTYNVDLDPSSGTFLVTGSGFFIEKFDPNGNMVWVVPFPVIFNSNTSYLSPIDLACDAMGNVYCIANISNSGLDFIYNSTLDTIQYTFNANEDMAMIKITPSGTVDWGYLFGNAGSEEFSSITCYGNSIYVGGMFGCYTDFDPSDSTVSQPSIAAWCRAGFMAKYNSAGEFIWQKSLEGIAFGDPGYARPRSLVVDANQNIVIGGEMGGTVNFNPSVGMDTLGVYQGQGADAYFAKYDTNGTFIFVKQILAPIYYVWPSVTTDANSNIIVAGAFNGNVDTDPSVGVNLLVSNNAPSAYATDVFIAKYDANGNLLWSDKFGSTSGEDLLEITCDNNNNIVLSATLIDTCDIAIGTGIYMAPLTSTSTTYPECAIIKYSPSGALIYAFCLGGVGYNNYGGIVFDGNDMYCSGNYYGPLDVDPPSATLSLNDDGYMHVKYFDPTVVGFEPVLASTQILQVFPNPTSDYLHIGEVVRGTYSVISLDGKSVLNGSAKSTIDVSLLPAGVYLLQVVDEEGVTYQSRFAKQ